MKQKHYKGLTILESWFFEKINKIDRQLANSPKEQGGPKLKDSETSRKNITIITREYFKNLHFVKLQNVKDINFQIQPNHQD